MQTPTELNERNDLDDTRYATQEEGQAAVLSREEVIDKESTEMTRPKTRQLLYNHLLALTGRTKQGPTSFKQSRCSSSDKSALCATKGLFPHSSVTSKQPAIREASRLGRA